MALAFVGALYGLRHALRAAFGLDYAHQPWPEVLAYESLKFSVFDMLFAGVAFCIALVPGAGRRAAAGRAP